MNWKQGGLNLLEHGFTRVLDAGTSLFLVWILSPELFSVLALAQASVASALFFFPAPESILYRDFGLFRSLTPKKLALRLGWIRALGILKFPLALLFSLGWMPVFLHMNSGSLGFRDAFAALVWAFGLALAPQVVGPDREFLRMDLKLKRLNALTLIQKLLGLAATVVAVWLFPHAIWPLAVGTWVVTLGTLFLAGAWVGIPWPKLRALWRDQESKSWVRRGMREFSLWQHLSGTAQGWVQTLDVLMLGVFAFSAQWIGLYSITLKLANLALALPLGLGSLYSIWLGRKDLGRQGSQRAVVKKNEMGLLKGQTLKLFAITAIQNMVLLALAPFILNWMCRGRWTAEEQQQMVQWLFWILIGNLLMVSTYLTSGWINLRVSAQLFFLRVILPWAGVAVILYFLSVYFGGIYWAAVANVSVAAVFLLLVNRMFKTVSVSQWKLQGEER